jgi:serine/threonine protein kinase
MAMPEKRLHPSDDQLNAFSLGQLPPADAAEVESHISACDPCCETLLQLSTDDTFVALLQDTKKPDDGLTLDQTHGVAANDRRPPAAVHAALAEHPRYKLVELIAKGGMGDVFKAEHRMMERTVALKVIRHELMRKPEAVERFHREVKTAASLSHPNIVTSHDAEQAGDVHFLVMEYVDGVDLANLVKQQGALPVAEACDYIRQAATGLQYAHQRGMVHRDIKPHNLMVTADRTVKILDFGLASLTESLPSAGEDMPQESSLTAAGTIMGTPDFISPEQSQDAHGADIRSDIYSLGTTLYYLLSGKAPFADGSVMHKLKNHAETEPEPIENVQIDVPPELAEVIRRMMAKDPANRLQTPAEVAEALAPFVDRYRDEMPPSTPQASAGQSRRPPRTLLTLLFGAMVFLLGGIIYVVTDKGTLTIETPDDSVEVRIWRVNNETRDPNLKMKLSFVDTVKGSKVIRLPSGSYRVFLVDDSRFELNQDGFTLSRGDQVVVRVTGPEPTTPGELPAVELDRTWQINEWPILDLDISVDGKWLASAHRSPDEYEVWLWPLDKSTDTTRAWYPKVAGGEVRDLKIAPDNQRVAWVETDGWLRTSELSKDGGEAVDFEQAASALHCVAWSPTSELIATTNG